MKLQNWNRRGSSEAKAGFFLALVSELNLRPLNANFSNDFWMM